MTLVQQLTPNPQTSISAWIGDTLDEDSLIAGGARVDATQFLALDAVSAVVGAAGAAVSATTVPVAALSGPIPNGTTLWFGGAKYAHLTAAAAAGATSLAVTALVTALVSGDVGTYSGVGKVLVPSGTIVGRTFAERDANNGFGPALTSDDEIYLVVFDVSDANQDADVTLYRPRALVKDNFLPTFATMGATMLGKIRGIYTCIRGTD
jgi:hypothetical protein